MKKNTVTIISTIILFIPWTILILRMNTWALVSPIAEIIIIIYAVIMIISGLFTAISYIKMEVQNHLMKICLVINSLYSIFGIAILGMIAFPTLF